MIIIKKIRLYCQDLTLKPTKEANKRIYQEKATTQEKKWRNWDKECFFSVTKRWESEIEKEGHYETLLLNDMLEPDEKLHKKKIKKKEDSRYELCGYTFFDYFFFFFDFERVVFVLFLIITR